MCDSLQICLVGPENTNILTPYGVKTAAIASNSYRMGRCNIMILQRPSSEKRLVGSERAAFIYGT